jgi:hypothetical protein
MEGPSTWQLCRVNCTAKKIHSAKRRVITISRSTDIFFLDRILIIAYLLGLFHLCLENRFMRAEGVLSLSFPVKEGFLHASDYLHHW